MVTSSLKIGVTFVDEKDSTPLCGPTELIVEVVSDVYIFAVGSVSFCLFFLAKFELEEGSMDTFGDFQWC